MVSVVVFPHRRAIVKAMLRGWDNGFMFHLTSRRAVAALLSVLACALLTVACNPAYDWREHHFEDGGFTILFPQKPGRAERNLTTPAGEVTMKMVSVRVEDTVFGAASADFAAPPDAAALAAMHAALLKNLDGRVHSDQPVTSSAPAALAGREVVKRGTIGIRIGIGSGGASGKNGYAGKSGAGEKGSTGESAVEAQLRARFFVRGNRYYQIAVMGRQGAVADADLDLFFASFKPD